MQVQNYASMQVGTYASIQVCKYASMHEYASMQVCKCKFASMQVNANKERGHTYPRL